MAEFFISYRREDSEDIAGRIHDFLEIHYPDAVFRDVGINGGEVFRSRIDIALQQAAVVLVIIGQKWLVEGDDGWSRLNQEDDVLRQEIETAIKLEKTVIPVLVNAAKLPSKEDLPLSLRPLLEREWVRVDSGRGFQQTMAQLVLDLRESVDDGSPSPGDESGQDPEEQIRELETLRLEITQELDKGDFKSAKKKLEAIERHGSPALRQFRRWAKATRSGMEAKQKRRTELCNSWRQAAETIEILGDEAAASRWRDRAENQVSEKPPEGKTGPTNAEKPWKLSAILPRDVKYTIVTGSRRQYPRRSLRFACDLLLPVACGDFTLLGRLPDAANHIVLDDEHFYPEWQRWQKQVEPSQSFRLPLLCIGTPEVNFAALLLNELSLFRFILDGRAKDDLLKLTLSLQEQSHHRYEAYRKSRTDLEEIVDRLCRPIFFDPLADELVRDKTRDVPNLQYGVISVGLHPLAYERLCILAAGVTGATTTGAVDLLNGREIEDPYTDGKRSLSSRPFGGIFRHIVPSDPRSPGDFDKIHEHLEWVTPPYEKEQMIERLRLIRRSPRLPPQVERSGLERLVGLLESTSMPEKPHRYCSCHAVVLTGGRGTRTNEKDKASLGIVREKDPAPHETLIGLIVGALAATERVEDVCLLSSDVCEKRWLRNHRRLAAELARVFDLEIRVESDGGDGSHFSVKSLVAILDTLPTDDHPILLMMGDTLVSPRDIRKLLEKVNPEEPCVWIACRDIGPELRENYGILRCSDTDRIDEICEKDLDQEGPASQGVYVFSSSLDLRRLLSTPIDRIKGSGDVLDPTDHAHLVDFCNWMIAAGIPVKKFMLDEPFFDCGHPEGLKAAREKVAADKSFWSRQTDSP